MSYMREGGNISALTGSTINIGEWRMSSIVYDGSNFRMYENGALL